MRQIRGEGTGQTDGQMNRQTGRWIRRQEWKQIDRQKGRMEREKRNGSS